MSTTWIYLISFGVPGLCLLLLIGYLAWVARYDDMHGHGGGDHHWPTFRARTQAWMTARYGPSKNVPALVVLPPDASAGTLNLPSVAANRDSGSRGPVHVGADSHAGEPYVTAPTSPCGTVTSPAGARAESGRAEPPVPGPGGAPSTVHHFAALAWQYAGDNARTRCWPMGDADTGYSREHRDQLRAILIDDHAAATVQIRRRFADLEIRDQHRFAAITAGIKAGAA